MTHQIIQKFSANHQYPVIFTNDVFSLENNVFLDTLQLAGTQQHKVLFIVDSGVLAAHPALESQIQSYVSQHSEQISQAGELFVVPGGERAKQDPRLINQIYQLIADHAICRHSFIVVIGGGAVIDAVGYAAATAHRGVRLIRIPTTVLAQNDAGLGVKNAINLDKRKNFIGTFSPPWAVLCDYDFLQTLGAIDKRSGMAEAVKVALIRDKVFFDFLYQQRDALSRFEKEPVQTLINICAKLHLDHIATSGDPFEHGSARPLDFGHWLAHKLEELSLNTLRHGEAVAIGIAVDSHYSHQLGWISDEELTKILLVLQTLGFVLNTSVLKQVDTELALDEFRQHLGGNLTITLLKGIGLSQEVDHIDTIAMQKSIDYIARFS